jgi:hypothetical protein
LDVSAAETLHADPEWLKLKAIPEYADKEIVLKVTNRLAHAHAVFGF